MITKMIGAIFIAVGLIVSILDRFMCRKLCSNCTNQQLNPCFFLFLFVGIIFVVVGYSLLALRNQKTQLPSAEFVGKD